MIIAMNVSGITRICAAGLLALVAGGWPSGAWAQVSYVRLPGSFGPELENPAKPFASIETAVAALPNLGGKVRIAPGLYQEKNGLHLSSPSTLTVDPDLGGIVTIGGARPRLAETTLRFITQNCRLFELPPGQRFFDWERTGHWGDYFGGRRRELDFVALCEVWENFPLADEDDLYFTTIFNRSGFLGGFYPLELGGLEINLSNAGLAFLSNLSFTGEQFHVFDVCKGTDCWAAKGWMQADVHKDGFVIRVYNTHTQAWAHGGAERKAQLEQIRGSIEHFLVNVPGGVALLVGDLNIEAAEYAAFSQIFESLGGRDLARNDPAAMIFDTPIEANSYRPDENTLAAGFCDDECGNARFDFVIYFSSLNGAVAVEPMSLKIVKAMVGGDPLDNQSGVSSKNLSDHYGLEAELRLLRLR